MPSFPAMSLIFARSCGKVFLSNKFATRSLSTSALRMTKVENLLILGSGLMGAGVAQVSAASGKFNSVVLQDISQDQLGKAQAGIKQSLQRVQKKDPSVDPDAIVSKITFSTEVEPREIGDGLLVIEAVPEKLELKQNLFKSLYEKFGSNDKVILATNTSSLPCRDIGVHIENKNRFAGLHFFNPVPMMKLVEIVRVDNGTDDSTYNALVDYVKAIGKVGVTCKDTPGFIVNRLLIPYMAEAVKMMERGDATYQDIDIAMKLGAGYPMGPFELIDYTGIDTNVFIAERFFDPRTGERIMHASETLKKMVEQGKLGRKSGQGFYNYKK